MINSHLQTIIRLEKEAECARKKIKELEEKLKSFVTSSALLDQHCPKPINYMPISDNVKNFDKVKVEDCDDKTDDENEKKIFLKLKENFQETVLQSTEKGECSTQKPLKKKVEQKQKIQKMFKTRIKVHQLNHPIAMKKTQKSEIQNSKIVGNQWCGLDHSAQKPNQISRRRWNENSPKTNHFNDKKLRNDQYYKSNQCYDLSVWVEDGEWYDNIVCYRCGYQGHITVNCQSWSFETRRCYNC
ncbi:putative transcription factor interactor and regulator CCHC(Zn) family [Helianthus anomalus]